MKIATAQLSNHLKSNFAPLYIVSGDEPFQKQSCVNAILKKAKQENFLDRQVYHADDKSFSWEIIFNALQSPSLFADKSLFEIHFKKTAIGAANAKWLVQIANLLTDNQKLLLIFPKFESQTLKSKWYQSLDKIGVTTQTWPISAYEFPSWITTRAKVHRVSLANDALSCIAEMTQGNLLATEQVLSQLSLVYPEQVINQQQALSLLTNNSRYNIFEFVDAIISKKTALALNILSRLQGAGEQPVLIVWALHREVSQLIQIKRQLDAGHPLAELLKPVFSSRQNMIKAAIKTISMTTLNNSLRQLADIDRAVKGFTQHDAWLLLSNLVLLLCMNKTTC